MAGIGVRLNKIYGKNTLTTDLVGVGYSTVVTIAPMLVVIGAIVAMEYFLGFPESGIGRENFFLVRYLYFYLFTFDSSTVQLGVVPLYVRCHLQ